MRRTTFAMCVCKVRGGQPVRWATTGKLQHSPVGGEVTVHLTHMGTKQLAE